jgi:hypothetical protein
VEHRRQQQAQDRGETLLIDSAGRPLTHRVRRVLLADRFFLGPLLGGSFSLRVPKKHLATDETQMKHG